MALFILLLLASSLGFASVETLNRCESIFAELSNTSALAPQSESVIPAALAAQDPFQTSSIAFIRSDRSAGGSQGGEWFRRGADGPYYFGKDYGGNIERMAAEHLANEIYRSMGVSTAETSLQRVDGKPYFMSREVTDAAPVESLAQLRQTDAKRNFVIDAWMANWDVIGMSYDNVLVGNGKAVRIDMGGTLLWRARGEKRAFPKEVGELQTMRNRSYTSGEIFGWLTEAQISGQIRHFMDRYVSSREGIREQVERSVLSKEIKTEILAKLDARATWLITEGLEQFHPKGLKKSESLERAAAEFKEIYKGDFDKDAAFIRRRASEVGLSLAKLSDAEILAIDTYKGGEFDSINEALRDMDTKSRWSWLPPGVRQTLQLEVWRPAIELAVSGLAKMPVYKGWVQRIVSFGPEDVQRYPVGEEVTETAFTSTTANGAPPYGGNVTFQIYSKTGKQISSFDGEYTTEDEVLFPPMTKFKVISKKQIRKNEWLIRMKEI